MIDVIEAWLRLAATRLHEQAATLTALDQAIGDGDHGTNMDRGFTKVAATLDGDRPEGDGEYAVAGAILRVTGKTLISTVGGASGPLYGTAFLRASGAVAAADPAEAAAGVLVAALEAAIGGIESLGKATHRREDDARCPRPRRDGRPRGRRGGRRRRRGVPGDGRCRRGGRGRDDPDACDQGSRVLPR